MGADAIPTNKETRSFFILCIVLFMRNKPFVLMDAIMRLGGSDVFATFVNRHSSARVFLLSPFLSGTMSYMYHRLLRYYK